MAVLKVHAGWDLSCDAVPQIAVLQQGMEMEMGWYAQLHPELGLGPACGAGGELLPLGGVCA